MSPVVNIGERGRSQIRSKRRGLRVQPMSGDEDAGMVEESEECMLGQELKILKIQVVAAQIFEIESDSQRQLCMRRMQRIPV